MEVSRARDDHKKSQPRSIPQLLTPEEPSRDSFSQVDPVAPLVRRPASPPESPQSRPCSGAAEFTRADQVLYPDGPSALRPAADRPLFGPNNTWLTPSHPDRVPAAPAPAISSSSSVSRSAQPNAPVPRTWRILEEAGNSASGSKRSSTSIIQMYNADPAGWYKHCMDQLERIRQIKRAAMEQDLQESRKSAVPHACSHRAARAPRAPDALAVVDSGRIEKPRAVPSTSTRARPPRAAPSKPAQAGAMAMETVSKTEPSAKRGRRQASTPDAAGGMSHNPKPRTRQPPSKKIEDKDHDWQSIPDRSPPVETLNDTSKKLSAVWSNANHLDLTNDPNKDCLHPQELELASTLRLKCNQYLANKRRIFAARLNHLREDRDFNKTSAQNCCSIDVNKASCLWKAFDGVGWFDEKYFSQYP